MSDAQKIHILDAFLAEIRTLSVAAIEAGTEQPDPLDQVRTACDYLQQQFEAAAVRKN